jgi:hypothetical protein
MRRGEVVRGVAGAPRERERERERRTSTAPAATSGAAMEVPDWVSTVHCRV